MDISKSDEIATLEDYNLYLKKIKALLEHFDVKKDLKIESLNEADYVNINNLIPVTEGRKIKFVENNYPHLFYYNTEIGDIDF